MTKIEIKNKDSLEYLKSLEDNSINLAIYDPPYFSTKKDSVGDKQWKNKNDYINWCLDIIKETQRVLKDNGSFYWFHNDINLMIDLLYRVKQETKFILKNQIIWNKLNTHIKTNFSMMVQLYGQQRSYNNIINEYCFYFTFQDGTGLEKVMLDVNNFKTLRNYFRDIQKEIGITKKAIIEKIGQCVDHCFRWNSSQWDLPTEETYNKILEVFKKELYNFSVREYESLRQEYESLRQEYESLRQEYESLRFSFNQPFKDFNNKTLEEEKEMLKNYSTIWEFSRDEDIYKLHETPKPLEMIKHIINVSSNPGDIVLDVFSGSGTTALGSIETNRNFKGTDKISKYNQVAYDRCFDYIKDNYMHDVVELDVEI